jgi:SGNH hydrolase-like domain, acetyltransferase AlgX
MKNKPNPHDKAHGSDAPSDLMAGSSIKRSTAWALIIFFAILIITPPIHQISTEWQQVGPEHLKITGILGVFPTHESNKLFENTLARDSILASQARKFYQNLVTRTLGQGIETVVVGLDGFLFFRKEVDYCAGKGFLSIRSHKHENRAVDSRTADSNCSPLESIFDYHSKLKERGIQLVVVPIPIKPSVYPDKIWHHYSNEAGPGLNPDHRLFCQRLAEKGVKCIDLADDFWKARFAAPEFLYLRGDTHWSPRGVALAADNIAKECEALVTHKGSGVFEIVIV